MFQDKNIIENLLILFLLASLVSANESENENLTLITEKSCTDFTHKIDLKPFLQAQNNMNTKITNMEACLGQKVERVLDKISSLTKNEHVCPSNLICIENVKRETGRFLGCYKDNRLQRILKGYATRLNFNTKESCVDICLEKRFVYAGTEAGDWCYCGNSGPVTGLNKRLTDDQCFRECPGNFKQHCGGPLAINIYETGVTEYRFDPEQIRIGESLTTSRQEFVLKFDCNRKYI